MSDAISENAAWSQENPPSKKRYEVYREQREQETHTQEAATPRSALRLLLGEMRYYPARAIELVVSADLEEDTEQRLLLLNSAKDILATEIERLN